MKNLLLLMTAAIAAFFAAAQSEPTDLTIYKLKGNVKSVNEIIYDGVEKFGELEKGAKMSRKYREFNSKGFELLFLLEYYEDDEKDKFSRTIRYENDKPIEIKEDDNGEVSLSRGKYNQQGLLESIDELDRKNKLLSRQKNKYNAEGLRIQSDTYKADGSREMKVINTYNSKKQLVKEEWFEVEGKLTSWTTYVYDSRGNEVERSTFRYEIKDRKPHRVYKYVYNEKDQKIEERNSITGLDKKETFEYNAQGDVKRHVDAYGEEEKKVYTYDGQGNWIKCIVTKDSDGKLSYEIMERQINYYTAVQARHKTTSNSVSASTGKKTKEQLLEIINSKIKETVGLSLVDHDKNLFTIKKASFYGKEGNVVFGCTFTDKNQISADWIFSFNPKEINTIEEYASPEGYKINLMIITFKEKRVQQVSIYQSEKTTTMDDEVILYFSNASKLNGAVLKDALLELKQTF